MLVKIITYNPVSGKGVYMTTKGEKKNFRYTMFENQVAIWPGEIALLKDEVLVKARWYHYILWVIRRAIRWLY